MITALGAGIGEEFDIRKAALSQDHHHGRCRCGRQPYPHAAADLLLPLYAPADRERLRLFRRAAAVQAHRGKSSGSPTPTRSATASPPRCGRQPQREVDITATKAWARWTPTSCGRPPWTPRPVPCAHHARGRRADEHVHRPHGRKGRAAARSSSSNAKYAVNLDISACSLREGGRVSMAPCKDDTARKTFSRIGRRYPSVQLVRR